MGGGVILLRMFIIDPEYLLVSAPRLPPGFSQPRSSSSSPLAGFNAAIAGCFFAVETVLRPASGEAAPTLTISIVMMASVLSSTVARVFLGEAPAFTVPEYEIRSAAGKASALLEHCKLSSKAYDGRFERT